MSYFRRISFLLLIVAHAKRTFNSMEFHYFEAAIECFEESCLNKTQNIFLPIFQCINWSTGHFRILYAFYSIYYGIILEKRVYKTFK